MSDVVGNLKDRFSHGAANISLGMRNLFSEFLNVRLREACADTENETRVILLSRQIANKKYKSEFL